MSRAPDSDNLTDLPQPDWDAIGSEAGIAVHSAALIGEGWSGRAYRVNDEFVFKFPKRAKEWQELDREIGFLGLARKRLSLPAAEHLFQIRRSAGARHGYGVYRHIPGEGAVKAVASGLDPSRLGTILARFLRALHGMEPDGELRSLLPREDERAAAEEYLQLARTHVVPRLSGEQAKRLHELFEAYLGDSANFSATPRIVHADLSAEHVLCHEGAVTGILDWGDVCLGDPDYDFSYLYGALGDAFVREMASHYEHPYPDRLLRKARYFWIVDQVDTIACSDGRAPAGDLRAAWRGLRELLR